MNLDDYAIRSELERKTLEEIERILFGFEKKRMSKTEALQALQVLWNTVSGLVASETMNLISSTRQEVTNTFDPKSFEQAIVMQGQGAGVVLMRQGAVMRIVQCAGPISGVDKDKTLEPDIMFPELAAHDGISALVRHYSANKGFKPIT